MHKNTHITIIEDDELLRDSLVYFFQKQGYVVSEFASAEGAVEFIENGDTDILLCDIVLPEQSGLDVIKQLQHLPHLGKILISGKTELTDRINGLRLGVDDYICKPIDQTELLLRVQSLINRLHALPSAPDKEQSSLLSFLSFKLNLEDRTLMAQDNSKVNLSPNEFNLLTYLHSQQGKICSRDKIAQALNSPEYRLAGRALDILVSRLRKKMQKLAPDTTPIVTYRGKGYMLPLN